MHWKKIGKNILIFILGVVSTIGIEKTIDKLFPDNTIEDRNDAILIQNEIAEIRTQLNILKKGVLDNNLSQHEIEKLYNSLYSSFEKIRSPVLRYPWKNDVIVESNNINIINNGKRISGKDYSILILSGIIEGIEIINQNKDLFSHSCNNLDLSNEGSEIVEKMFMCNTSKLALGQIEIFLEHSINSIEQELDNNVNGFKKDGKERKIYIDDLTKQENKTK